MNEYTSPVYGVGAIISRMPGEIVVRFDAPPGMNHDAGIHIVPVVHIAIPEELR